MLIQRDRQSLSWMIVLYWILGEIFGFLLGFQSGSHADSCVDVQLIFARGTNEPPGIGRVGQDLFDRLRSKTSRAVNTYAVDYPAGRLQLGGGDGAKDVIEHVKYMAVMCPDTQLVLGGYSQGASVMDIVTGTPVGGIRWGASLPQQYHHQIAAVVTFGNPADRAGGPINVQSIDFASKALDICHPGDPICHHGPGNDWRDHVDGYIPVLTDQAATFILAKLH